MIPGAGSTDTPLEGEVEHGRHKIVAANGHPAEVTDGHHVAEVADGHHVAEVANGDHPAHGRHVARAPEEEPVAGNR